MLFTLVVESEPGVELDHKGTMPTILRILADRFQKGETEGVVGRADGSFNFGRFLVEYGKA